MMKTDFLITKLCHYYSLPVKFTVKITENVWSSSMMKTDFLIAKLCHYYSLPVKFVWAKFSGGNNSGCINREI